MESLYKKKKLGKEKFAKVFIPFIHIYPEQLFFMETVKIQSNACLHG